MGRSIGKDNVLEYDAEKRVSYFDQSYGSSDIVLH